MTERPLSPAGLRDLAAAAEHLAARIDVADSALAADPDDHRSRTGFRLSDAAGQCRQAAAALEETAGDLARIAAVPAHACPIGWGVCPDHGNTLTGSGGRAWCRSAGCGRRWGYDRLGSPCAEPVTHRVTDAEGTVHDVCDGHAIDCRERLIGATVTRLTRPEQVP
jgi:hypothetical protein